MPEKPDDLDAVRNIVKTLESFEAADQERIVRWAREKLGLPVEIVPEGTEEVVPRQVEALQSPSAKDIKTFVAEKNPTSNNEFAATVAYYYRFAAPESARKDSVTGDDLQEACRLTGRTRLTRPAQTLINAHTAGLLDKAGDRGAYAISTVGENLVAVTLPSSKT